MTEPKTKEDKEAGRLSVTCQQELIKIYNWVKYGRKKELSGPQIEKGTVCEPESILLYSKVEGKLFHKNDEQLENEWFTGHPDIFTGENIRAADEVDDIKTRWAMETFTPKLIEKVDPGEVNQMNVYYSLTGAKSGAIVNTLVSAPTYMVEEAKYYLMKRLNVATEYSPEAIEAIQELEKNMIFEDIDYRERVIKKMVPRDDELIEKMKAKVPALRNWLQEFHEKHMAQYPKN
jgi:hypothetical protein